METLIPEQLAALSHPKRLALFHLLMRRYPDSVAAGQITRALGLKANTASVYLSALRQAGLIEQRRVATSLHYSANLPQIRALFGALMGDCCQNRPDLCLPLPGGGTPDPDRPLHVLFLCAGNSARAFVSEAILQAEGAGRFSAHSAGTRPTGAPHPQVLALLRDKSHDIYRRLPPSRWTGSAPATHRRWILSSASATRRQTSHARSGHPMRAHWGLPAPVAASGAGQKQTIEAAYALIERRIRAFVSLPLEQLPPVARQHAIDDIGRMQAQITQNPTDNSTDNPTDNSTGGND